MKTKVTESIGFLRTTAIGGIFFLFPLIVVGALLGQMLQVIWGVARSVDAWLPLQSLLGYWLLLIVGIAAIVASCFVAGIFAKRALARRFTGYVEKYLLTLFPRYAIFKEQLSGNLGGEVMQNQLKPVLISLHDTMRLGFEVERCGDGESAASRVTVFLPGAPDPWNGQIAMVAARQVRTLDVPFSELLATFEQLGKNSARVATRLFDANHSTTPTR